MNSKNFTNVFLSISKLLLITLFVTAILTGITIAEDKNNILRIRWIIDEVLISNPGLSSAKLSWDA